MRNIRIFYLKNCHFLVIKFSVYFNRRVFVMAKIQGTIFLLRLCMRAYACVCVYGCVRACVRARVCVCVCMLTPIL